MRVQNVTFVSEALIWIFNFCLSPWLGLLSFYSFMKHGLAACLKVFCPNLKVKYWEKYLKYLHPIYLVQFQVRFQTWVEFEPWVEPGHSIKTHSKLTKPPVSNPELKPEFFWFRLKPEQINWVLDPSWTLPGPFLDRPICWNLIEPYLLNLNCKIHIRKIFFSNRTNKHTDNQGKL